MCPSGLHGEYVQVSSPFRERVGRGFGIFLMGKFYGTQSVGALHKHILEFLRMKKLQGKNAQAFLSRQGCRGAGCHHRDDSSPKMPRE
jgi:hypothetical protein